MNELLHIPARADLVIQNRVVPHDPTLVNGVLDVVDELLLWNVSDLTI